MHPLSVRMSALSEAIWDEGRVPDDCADLAAAWTYQDACIERYNALLYAALRGERDDRTAN